MTKRIKVSKKYVSRSLSELSLLISDHVTAMLAYWDKDLVCRYANSAYVDWFCKTKEQMINNIRIDELLGPLYEKNLPYIKGVLLGKKNCLNGRYQFQVAQRSDIHLPPIFLI